MLLVGVVSALALSSALSIAGAPADRSMGSVRFSLLPCKELVQEHIGAVKVSYSFAPTDGNGTANSVKTLWDSAINGVAEWPHPLRSSLSLNLSIPPGFYHYSVNAEFLGNKHGLCQEQLYIAVLPGKKQAITAAMDDGVADPVTMLLLTGLLPEGVRASIVRYDNAPACGAVLDRLVAHPLIYFVSDSGAYYGYDDALTAKNGGAITFGLQLTWPSRQQRTLRLVADYPDEIISGPPTFKRVDVKNDIAGTLLAQDPRTLLCETD